MKGLLIKDFHLAKLQKSFFIVFIALALLISFLSGNSLFSVGYLTIVMPMFALSTISYDEFDNGNAFLFTLPISRKEYVIEKYIFSLILGIASFIIAVIMALGLGCFRNMLLTLSSLKLAPITFGIMVLLHSVMLPLQLKFGAEKGRIAVLIGSGILFAVSFGVFEIILLTTDIEELDLMNFISNLNIGILIAVGVIILSAIFLISMKISIKIMENKEF